MIQCIQCILASLFSSTHRITDLCVAELCPEQRKRLEKRKNLLETARWCISSFGDVSSIDASSTISAVSKLFEEEAVPSTPGSNQPDRFAVRNRPQLYVLD